MDRPDDLDRFAREARETGRIFAGEEACDLLIRGARVVDLFRGELRERDVAIHRGRVIALEELPAEDVYDAGGRILAPGFVDGHIHIESTMLTPPEFARAVVKRGTTAVFADPHEIVNSLGEKGLRFMLEASEDIPLDIFFLLPSCVPATPFETAGGEFPPSLMMKYRGHDRVAGLGEFMNFPGVLSGDRTCLEKLHLFRDGIIDGHAPMLSGKDLSLYILRGMRSDHETTSPGEGEEKLAKGMFLFLREGTSSKNLKDLCPLVRPYSCGRFGFASDDRSPREIEQNGHVDDMLRKAVRYGMKPLEALRIACYNPFRYFRFFDRGALAPGFRADLVLFDRLGSFRVRDVLKNGQWVCRDGDYVRSFGTSAVRKSLSHFDIPDRRTLQGRIRVMPKGRRLRFLRLVENQILIEKGEADIGSGGHPLSAQSLGMAKLAVVERHQGTGRVGVGFLAGLGLESGAIGSTVAHDSHNLILAGMDDGDMLLAAEKLRTSRGGIVVVRRGETLAHLPLPVGGLMSDLPYERVSALHRSAERAAATLGKRVVRNPFMYLSFAALPVIPHLRLTDRGLFDVDAFRFVPLTN